MVAQHIPTILVIFSVLAAYRLLGVGEYFDTLTRKELQLKYDYVIGRTSSPIFFIYSMGSQSGLTIYLCVCLTKFIVEVNSYHEKDCSYHIV